MSNFKNLKVTRSLKAKGSLNCGQKAVVQATNNNTAVTINSASGKITMNSITSSSNSFTVNNNKVDANSIILLTFMSHVQWAPILTVSGVGNGVFTINLDAVTGTVEIPVIGFLVC